MANKQSYVIRIQYDTPDGAPTGDVPDNGGGAGRRGAETKTDPKVTPAAIVTPFVRTGMQMQTQYISTVTGSGQLARRQQLINGVVTTATDFANKAVSGATVAASLASVGGPVGVAVGVAMAAVGEALKIATNIADLKNKQEVEKTAINATRARAGISWDKSRER